jgi:hypothetical protein
MNFSFHASFFFSFFLSLFFNPQIHPCYYSPGSSSPLLFSFFPLTHLYSFGSYFPLCASFLVFVFFIHPPFYSPSLYTFSRLFGFSSSLVLQINLQFLLSLIPYKPFPIYLYLPVSYFHPFSSISLFSSHLF